MARQSTRSTYPLAEHARVRGGQILITTHGPNCKSRSGGECACAPRYTLRRQPKAGAR
jgi:hypothetical protein